ncbi:winged helix-turn-helix transcriptional regulator [Candidatus Saccharibacteria bacterium]|nr:winged helix-turn-helix transcriptional regulator [Candidatus Saccharibacteria bacterium]
MAIKVPIRFRGDKSKTGLEAERIFNIAEWQKLQDSVANAHRVIMAKALENFELLPVEWLFMKNLSEDKLENNTLTYISEALSMNLPQATLLCSRMIKKGLIRKKTSQKDRRVKYLHCTRKGQKLLYEGEQSIQHAMRYWLFDLTDIEIEQYVRILKKINGFDIPITFN